MNQPGTVPSSRRAALRAGAAAAAALIGGGWARTARAQDGVPGDTPPPNFHPGGRVIVNYDETVSFNEMYHHPPLLGRVEAHRLRVVEDPALYDSAVVRWVRYADVLPIYRAIRSAESRWSYRHNDVWFDVGDGFIHSSWVVPVREVFQEPEDVIGDGFWGEISVPTSWQHWKPELYSPRYFDMAFGAVFHVIDRADEPNGRAWYRLYADIAPTAQYWVQAAHVRRIDRAEFDPISPAVPPEEKRIDIDLTRQILTCYEGDSPVFSTLVATGTVFRDAAGNLHEFYTPRGNYRVYYKRPSRHMRGGESIDDYYDLPGVPWCVFINRDGVAIHGTYWHNDYGRPRSHGCINVTCDAAKWIYRWVNPYTGYDVIDHRTQADEREIATRVHVFNS